MGGAPFAEITRKSGDVSMFRHVKIVSLLHKLKYQLTVPSIVYLIPERFQSGARLVLEKSQSDPKVTPEWSESGPREKYIHIGQLLLRELRSILPQN